MNSVLQQLRSSDYEKKLKSPEWRDFTRNVRRERGNACEMCKRAHLVTEVHHWFYEKDREPWEYRIDEVVVLCHECHHETHERLKEFRKYVFTYLTPQAFRVLNGALLVALKHYEPLVFCHALAEFVSNPGVVKRYAGSWAGELEKDTEEKAFRKFQMSMKRKLPTEPPR